jgi:XTP/dITP diphosphohydrolase
VSSIQFITSNPHKFQEVHSKLIERGIHIDHLKMKYNELQADTIDEVVTASAANLSAIIDGDFIIEDSGLAIDKLQGFPGPYSSYVYQTLGWEGILDLMKNKENRMATFMSVFVLIKKNQLFTFRGECRGEISLQGKGSQGFGFDPIFIPQSYNETFAELPLEVKNKVSHRARSLDKLLEFITR